MLLVYHHGRAHSCIQIIHFPDVLRDMRIAITALDLLHSSL